MTLAGTRPPTVDEWDKYELHHRARLATKPGLTGMWQVSGRSNITDFEEVVKLDKQYISEWTMGLDIIGLPPEIFSSFDEGNIPTSRESILDKTENMLNIFFKNIFTDVHGVYYKRTYKALGEDATYYKGETSDSPDLTDTSTENIKKNLKDEKLSKYREGESYEERGYFEHAELQINYDIKIDKLTELYFSDLKKMKFKDETQDPLRSLDTLYRKKGLI